MTTRRDALIDAAAALLDAGGLTAVTLRDVGRAAGVSHNAPYKHFANKEELLAAVARREIERLSDGAADAEAGPGGAAGGPSARELVAAFVRWALANPARHHLTLGPWAPDRHPSLHAAADRWRALLGAAVARAQAGGQLPPGDPERMGALLLASAHGAVALALAGHLGPAAGKGRADPEGLVADLFDHLERERARPRDRPASGGRRPAAPGR